MSLTTKQIYDLNNMNVAAQNAQLGTMVNNPTAQISAATTTANGTVKMSANVPEAAGDNPTAAEFKALLDALIAAGIMSAS